MLKVLVDTERQAVDQKLEFLAFPGKQVPLSLCAAPDGLFIGVMFTGVNASEELIKILVELDDA